jgi:acetoin utilization protein AcuC
MTDFEFVYSDAYLRYVLGEHHPTNPLRAFLTLDLLAQHDVPHTLVTPEQASLDDLRLAHTPEHIMRVANGRDFEWDGYRPWLHDTARLIYGGTLDAARRIAAGQTVRAFNPMGAKHHAMPDHASGFCIYNDIAGAGRFLTSLGMRVLYLDWDIHHGDGVEAILGDDPAAMTASIHASLISPRMGRVADPARNVHNLWVPDGPHGSGFTRWVRSILALAVDFRPDVVLLAAGADGHAQDGMRLGRYQLSDYAIATRLVTEFADAYCGGRILAGGAGGYSPHTWTPRVWLTVCQVLAGVKPRTEWRSERSLDTTH